MDVPLDRACSYRARFPDGQKPASLHNRKAEPLRMAGVNGDSRMNPYGFSIPLHPGPGTAHEIGVMLSFVAAFVEHDHLPLDLAESLFLAH